MPPAEARRLFSAFEGEHLVALAVSGGSDSMAMLRLACDARNAQRCLALTVDHGLRTGSRAEAEQVGRWCSGLGVAHHTLTWTGEKPKTGVQAKARVARYDLMTGWCRANGVRMLMTAHTLEDQAETVAMRQARTDSPKSIAGIWPETEWAGVRIVRPLLAQRREALRDYLGHVGQPWLDDPSNENDAFERVRVRKALAREDVPVLAAHARIAQQQVRLRQASVAEWLKAHVEITPWGTVSLPRARLSVLDSAVAADVLAWAVSAAGAGRRPEPSAVSKVQAAVSSGYWGRFSLAGALVVLRKREVLVGREPGRMAAQDAIIPASGEVTWDERFVVSGPAGAIVQAAGLRCPKPVPQVPSFVLASLPEVQLPGGARCFAHFGPVAGVSARLSERFRL